MLSIQVFLITGLREIFAGIGVVGVSSRLRRLLLLKSTLELHNVGNVQWTMMPIASGDSVPNEVAIALVTCIQRDQHQWRCRSRPYDKDPST